MKRFGSATIQCVLHRAAQEFMDVASFDFVRFDWKGHHVEAFFRWSECCRCFYISSFMVVYSKSTVIYYCDFDYDFSSAVIEDFPFSD